MKEKAEIFFNELVTKESGDMKAPNCELLVANMSSQNSVMSLKVHFLHNPWNFLGDVSYE